MGQHQRTGKAGSAVFTWPTAARWRIAAAAHA